MHGKEQCKSDPCVFRLIREAKIVPYTMAVASPSDKIDEPQYEFVVLSEDFATNDLGELSFLTGGVFSQDLGGG